MIANSMNKRKQTAPKAKPVKFCDRCSFNTNEIVELIEHIKLEHNVDDVYLCDFCQYYTETLWNFQLHMEQHSANQAANNKKSNVSFSSLSSTSNATLNSSENESPIKEEDEDDEEEEEDENETSSDTEHNLHENDDQNGDCLREANKPSLKFKIKIGKTNNDDSSSKSDRKKSKPQHYYELVAKSNESDNNNEENEDITEEEEEDNGKIVNEFYEDEPEGLNNNNSKTNKKLEQEENDEEDEEDYESSSAGELSNKPKTESINKNVSNDFNSKKIKSNPDTKMLYGLSPQLGFPLNMSSTPTLNSLALANQQSFYNSYKTPQTPNASMNHSNGSTPGVEKAKRHYNSEVDPARYRKVIEEGITKFACSICGNTYKWRKSLNKHWKEKHITETPPPLDAPVTVKLRNGSTTINCIATGNGAAVPILPSQPAQQLVQQTPQINSIKKELINKTLPTSPSSTSSCSSSSTSNSFLTNKLAQQQLQILAQQQQPNPNDPLSFANYLSAIQQYMSSQQQLLLPPPVPFQLPTSSSKTNKQPSSNSNSVDSSPAKKKIKTIDQNTENGGGVEIPLDLSMKNISNLSKSANSKLNLVNSYNMNSVKEQDENLYTRNNRSVNKATNESSRHSSYDSNHSSNLNLKNLENSIKKIKPTSSGDHDRQSRDPTKKMNTNRSSSSSSTNSSSSNSSSNSRSSSNSSSTNSSSGSSKASSTQSTNSSSSSKQNPNHMNQNDEQYEDEGVQIESKNKNSYQSNTSLQMASSAGSSSTAYNQKLFVCSICDSKFHVVDHINEHFLKNHYNEYQRELSSKSPPRNTNVAQQNEEWNLSDPNNPLKCIKCDFVGRWPTELQKHAASHSTSRPFKCLICSLTYKWRWDLAKHFDRTHPTFRNPYKKRDRDAARSTLVGGSLSSNNSANTSLNQSHANGHEYDENDEQEQQELKQQQKSKHHHHHHHHHKSHKHDKQKQQQQQFEMSRSRSDSNHSNQSRSESEQSGLNLKKVPSKHQISSLIQPKAKSAKHEPQINTNLPNLQQPMFPSSISPSMMLNSSQNANPLYAYFSALAASSSKSAMPSLLQNQQLLAAFAATSADPSLQAALLPQLLNSAFMSNSSSSMSKEGAASLLSPSLSSSASSPQLHNYKSSSSSHNLAALSSSSSSTSSSSNTSNNNNNQSKKFKPSHNQTPNINESNNNSSSEYLNAGAPAGEKESRNFLCYWCDFRGRWRSEIIQHMRCHHAREKPYRCSACAYASNWKWDVQKHTKKQHPDNANAKIVEIPDQVLFPDLKDFNFFDNVKPTLSQTPQQTVGHSVVSAPLSMNSIMSSMGQMTSTPVQQGSNNKPSSLNLTPPSSSSSCSSSSSSSSSSNKLKQVQSLNRLNEKAKQQQPAQINKPTNQSSKNSSNKPQQNGNQQINKNHSLCCQQCPYVACNLTDLRRHLIVHSNEQPYHCCTCDFKSKWKSDVKKHQRSLNHVGPILVGKKAMQKVIESLGLDRTSMVTLYGPNIQVIDNKQCKSNEKLIDEDNLEYKSVQQSMNKNKSKQHVDLGKSVSQKRKRNEADDSVQQQQGYDEEDYEQLNDEDEYEELNEYDDQNCQLDEQNYNDDEDEQYYENNNNYNDEDELIAEENMNENGDNITSNDNIEINNQDEYEENNYDNEELNEMNHDENNDDEELEIDQDDY